MRHRHRPAGWPGECIAIGNGPWLHGERGVRHALCSELGKQLVAVIVALALALAVALAIALALALAVDLCLGSRASARPSRTVPVWKKT